MDLMWMFASEETKKRWAEEEKRYNEQILEKAVPWDPDMKWAPRLGLKAETFKPFSLFGVKPTKGLRARDVPERCKVYSPGKRWFYCEMRYPAKTRISIAFGRYKSFAVFDAPITFPALFSSDASSWQNGPWMSITPQEIFTLRPGTRFAKGTTVVAGLGLGYQLIEVSKRPQVKKLIVVEKDKALVRWLMPRIMPLLQKQVDVIIGDARELIPEMTADAALIDIFPSYGGNDFPKCPNVKKVWVWGSQYATIER